MIILKTSVNCEDKNSNYCTPKIRIRNSPLQIPQYKVKVCLPMIALTSRRQNYNGTGNKEGLKAKTS